MSLGFWLENTCSCRWIQTWAGSEFAGPVPPDFRGGCIKRRVAPGGQSTNLWVPGAVRVVHGGAGGHQGQPCASSREGERLVWGGLSFHL